METNDLKFLMQALVFGAVKHKDQLRKDPDASPYINQPIASANILVKEGHIMDLEAFCGTLLHDTVEDTKTTESRLTEAFRPAIAGIVMKVTDDKSLPKRERKRAQVEYAPNLSEGVLGKYGGRGRNRTEAHGFAILPTRLATTSNDGITVT